MKSFSFLPTITLPQTRNFSLPDAKTVLVIFALYLSFLCPVRSQPAIQWQKCLGGSKNDYATSIQQTKDGGYVASGHTRSQDGDASGNQGLYDFWVVKLDNLGYIQWEQTFGGGNDDWDISLQQTVDGGFIVAGSTDSNDGDVIGNHGSFDAWVVKLSNSGSIEWQKALGGSGWDEASSVQQTSDGGYIVAGTSNSNDGDVSGNHAGSSDFWIVKLNGIGTIEWQKSLGGSYDDGARSIKQTIDGGYIVAGETQSMDGDVIGNNGDADYWVIKLNNLGEIEWQNALGGVGIDVATDVVETNDGFVVCGYEGSGDTGDVTGSHGDFDYWIVKLNKMGDILWQKPYGGSDFDYARSIAPTSDGMFVIAGEAKSKDGDFAGNIGIQIVWVLKLNEMGELIWKKPLGGTQGDGCFSIKQTSDHGYILGGFSWSNDGDVSGNHGGSDFWVVKLSPESSSITEPHIGVLEISPNPAQHSIALSIPAEATTLMVSITDLLGREIARQTILNGGDLDVSWLPKGLYLISATAPSGEVYVGKMGKQ